MSGRPTEFSNDLADRICAELAEGKSLVSICKEDWAPSRSTVLLWVVKGERGDENYKTFSDSYARAREAQSHALVDEVIEIADDSSGDVSTDDNGNAHLNSEFAARSRIRIDARFKVAARMHQKKYGESATLKGDKDNPLVPAVFTLNLGTPQADADDTES